MSALLPAPRREIAPGAVHVPGWLDVPAQRRIVEAARDWARGPVPLHHTTIRGHPMSVATLCLGWHWLPYRYSRTADDVNGERVPPVPGWLADLGRAAVADAFSPEQAVDYDPDAVLVNHYDGTAKMGLHQDKDERSDAPVVSLSIGDTCRFRFGNTRTRTRPYTDVELASGDLFVFGGPPRFAFHGVMRTFPGTADPGCGLATGRLNLTLRVTGLSG